MFGWLVAGFINGIAGFGAAMIALPIITPVMDFSVIVPSTVLIVLTLNCQVGWTFRNYIEYRYIKEIFWGAIPGVIASVIVLEYIPENVLKAAMGGFIASYAFFGFFERPGIKKVIHPAWGYLSGFLSTSLGMAFGINGPPLAAFIAYCGCPAKAVKGMLGAGFIISGVCIVLGKIITGQITQTVLIIWLASVPAVIIGSKLGISLSANLSEKVFRKVLFSALCLMGLRIISSAI